jgi:MoxR-like ATPase
LTNVQIDRFAYRVMLDYHDAEAEKQILERVDSIETGHIEPSITKSEVMEIMAQVKQVYIDELLEEYIIDIVQDIRRSEYIRLGPSTRASIWLYHGSRALALMDGRSFVIPDDIKKLVRHVIPHKCELSQEARFQDISLMSIIDQTLETVPVPKGFDD